MSEKGMNQQGEEPLTEQSQDTAIRELDMWFRYAEEIGQQRLYNFLMSASIMLLACATILTSQTAPWHLSKVLSLCGVMLSFLWIIKGTRQSNFHKMLECEIARLLETHPRPSQFAIYHIQEMKKPRNMKANYQLNFLEQMFSTRRFLWIVPLVFLLVFLLTFLMSFKQPLMWFSG